MFAEPFFQSFLRLELGDLNAVDGWPGFADRFDVRFAHLLNPHHAMALEPAGRKVDGPFVQRHVEIAAPNQHEIDEIAGELEQQPFRRIVPPRAEPALGEPGTVAIAEAELDGTGAIPDA